MFAQNDEPQIGSVYGYNTSDRTCANSYVLPEVIKQLKYLSKGDRFNILDIGCGNGYVGATLADLCYNVTGIDSSVEGISIARAAHPTVRFEICSVYDNALTEIVGSPVDCVLSLEVVEHLYYPKALLEQSYLLLKSGGFLIISTPYHGYLKNLAISVLNGWDKHFSVNWDGGHIKFFSKKSLRQMAISTGFKHLRFSCVGRVPGLWKSMIMVAQK